MERLGRVTPFSATTVCPLSAKLVVSVQRISSTNISFDRPTFWQLRAPVLLATPPNGATAEAPIAVWLVDTGLLLDKTVLCAAPPVSLPLRTVRFALILVV